MKIWSSRIILTSLIRYSKEESKREVFLLVGDFYRQGLFNELNGDQLIKPMSHRTRLTILKLTINCRNTKEIALFASKLPDHPFPIAIQKPITGKKVELRFPIENRIKTNLPSYYDINKVYSKQ